LKRSVREVIVLMDDLDDDAEVDVHLVFVDSAARLGDERRELAMREADLQRQTVDVIGDLTERSYSVRDASVLLGVTPGRVSQLSRR
jgi:hypothetical protein